MVKNKQEGKEVVNEKTNKTVDERMEDYATKGIKVRYKQLLKDVAK